MSQSSFSYSKTPLNIQSTQEALNMLRSLREKRKKENPSSIYELVRSIYTFVRQNKKKQKIETISSEQYLGTNRQSIEDMLGFVKRQIGNLDRNENQQKQKERQEKTKLQKEIAVHKQEIKRLNETIKNAEQGSKSLQIKLLNNIKRLDKELCDRNKEIVHLRAALDERNQQFASLVQLNEKQHQRIRYMEEEMYEMDIQLQSKNEELQAERECADFLERRVSKFLSSDNRHKRQEAYNPQYQGQSNLSQEAQKVKLQENEINIKKFEQYGVQVEVGIDGKNSQQNDEDNASQGSKTISESKESRYIESIEKLTIQLGEAYQTINELVKKGESTSTREIKNNQFQIGEENSKSIITTNSEIESTPKKEKTKSKSGYFSKLWK